MINHKRNHKSNLKIVRTFCVVGLLQILKQEDDDEEHDEHIAQIPKRVYHTKL